MNFDKNNIQIGMLGVIIVLLLLNIFRGGSAGSGSGSIKDQARQAAGGNASTLPGTPTAANATNPAQPQAVPAEKPVDPSKATTAAFDQATFDFGKVKEGEKVTHVYKIKNTGKKPLEISACKGSCGCTVPKCPTEPIAPGASGDIKVEFDSKGKPGRQTKTVTVNANVMEPLTLTITGEVIKDPNAPATPAPAQGAPTIQAQPPTK